MLLASATDKLWLLAPHIGEAEKLFVQEAFDSNWIAPLGPNVAKFEAELSSYLHQIPTHLVSSGTAAIHLALKCLNVKAGDVVLCQSFTFAGSAFPILYEKAIPYFIDSETDTWNMDPNLLEDALKACEKKGIRAAAILVVHLYGMPAKMDAINAIANKYGVPVIEDAAEALGSQYHQQPCGTLADIAIFSFNGNKIVTTSGGGAIVSKNKEYIDKARYLSDHAKNNTHFYEHNEVGYNYRLSNVSAGIGRGQLQSLNNKVATKRAFFDTYKAILSDVEGISFVEEASNVFCNRWLTTVLFSDKLLAHTGLIGIKNRFDALNVETRFLWNPMHLQPVFADAPFFGSTTSQDLFASGLCLPSTTYFSFNTIVAIANTLKAMFYDAA